MKTLLAIAFLSAALAGCASAPQVATSTEPQAFEGPGATVAAELGFHGPVERRVERPVERLYSSNSD